MNLIQNWNLTTKYSLESYTGHYSFLPMDGTQTDTTTTPGQSEPGIIGNEQVFHIPHWSTTGTSPQISIKCYTQDTLVV